MEVTEERVSEPNVKSTDSCNLRNTEFRKETEQSFRDLWDNIKWSGLHITGVPEGEGKGISVEKKILRNNDQRFPKFGGRHKFIVQ